VRHQSELIGPALQRVVAKITKRQIAFDVLPDGDADTDADAARLVDKVVRGKAVEWQWSQLNRKATLWALITGHGYLKIWWDQTKGQQYNDGESYYDGDVQVEIVDPFSLYLEPGISCLADSSWAIVHQMRNLGWAIQRWPDKAEEIRKQAEAYSGSPARVREIATRRTSVMPWVSVRELWVRPQRTADDELARAGVYALAVGDVLVVGPEPYPFRDGQLPFVDWCDGHLQGLAYYGPTIIKGMRPIQIQYNRIQSSMIENLQLMGSPKWLVPNVCDVDRDAITNEPGEKISFTPGGQGERPEIVRPPETHPSTAEALANRCLTDFENVSGQHEVSRGMVPTGVTAGVAIAQLIEEDDTILGPLSDSVRHANELAMERVVKLYVEFAPDNVMRSIAYDRRGANGEIFQFTGRQLRFARIRVTPDSLQPTSLAARRAQVLDLWKAGLFTPDPNVPGAVEAARTALQLYEFGDVEMAFSDASLDRKKARWENQQLDSGASPSADILPRTFDDHKEHVRLHRNRQKELSYMSLPPSVQDAYEEHVAGHLSMIVDDQFQDQQIAQELSGLGLAVGQPAPVAGEAVAPQEPAAGESAQQGSQPEVDATA
jgi:hypothetical protein